jgi:hypothetical protein
MLNVIGGENMPDMNLPQIITAIGGLGTAAFGVVDATKVFGGGANHIGFSIVRSAAEPLLPPKSKDGGLSLDQMIQTLQANWFNGTDLASQKAIAKSLIKLNMSKENAAALAKATGVNATTLGDVADNIASGKPLTDSQPDFYARFDLILTALLDEAYQRADQAYRNGTRACATVVAVILAIAGMATLTGGFPQGQDLARAVVVGLLATPFAPIAKDLSSALGAAVNTLQLVKK